MFVFGMFVSATVPGDPQMAQRPRLASSSRHARTSAGRDSSRCVRASWPPPGMCSPATCRCRPASSGSSSTASPRASWSPTWRGGSCCSIPPPNAFCRSGSGTFRSKNGVRSTGPTSPTWSARFRPKSCRWHDRSAARWWMTARSSSAGTAVPEGGWISVSSRPIADSNGLHSGRRGDVPRHHGPEAPARAPPTPLEDRRGHGRRRPRHRQHGEHRVRQRRVRSR